MNLRLLFEQKLLPGLVYAGKEKFMGFVNAMLERRESLIKTFLNMSYESEKEKCPYDLDKITVDNRAISLGNDIPNFGIFIIDMPEADEEGMASRIFICFSQSFDFPFYLLAEKSASDSYAICSISERGDHFKFLEALDDRFEQLQKVAQLYAQYWELKVNENNQVGNTSRYYIEQTYLPQVVFSNEQLGEELLNGLLECDAKNMYLMFSSVYKDRGEECPYSEDQFVIRVEEVFGKDNSTNFCVITINMPEPEEMLLCSRIFICLEPALKNLRYFLVEKSFDDEYALCGKNGEGAHSNYGPAPGSEIEQFKKVCEIYEDYLKSTADK